MLGDQRTSFREEPLFLIGRRMCAPRLGGATPELTLAVRTTASPGGTLSQFRSRRGEARTRHINTQGATLAVQRMDFGAKIRSQSGLERSQPQWGHLAHLEGDKAKRPAAWNAGRPHHCYGLQQTAIGRGAASPTRQGAETAESRRLLPRDPATVFLVRFP